jgi:hypothetical protein
LNAISWAFWQGPDDTPRLIAEIIKAVAGDTLSIGTMEDKSGLGQGGTTSPPPPPSASAPLEMSEGTIDPQSAFAVGPAPTGCGADRAARARDLGPLRGFQSGWADTGLRRQR